MFNTLLARRHRGSAPSPGSNTQVGTGTGGVGAVRSSGLGRLSALSRFLDRLLTTDFCPGANRFVYWLKEPIGWFVLATAASVLVGLYFSPIGWTLATALAAIMAAGMAWPFVAVRVTECDLNPERARVHEDEACRMRLTVRNRFAFPVWGLAVEGFLDSADRSDGGQATTNSRPGMASSAVASGQASVPTVALACVPPLCRSRYHIDVHPKLRGHYPLVTPAVACSFPFGIWTARRPLDVTGRLTVWPKVYPVTGSCSMVGLTRSNQGEGDRSGREGDFVGVRGYRRGDSVRHVHWVASARTDTLIVTERGDPQNVHLSVWVDTWNGITLGGGETVRSTEVQIADRVRVAASVLVNVHQSGVPIRLQVGPQRMPAGAGVEVAAGEKGRRQILDTLTNVPVGGESRKGPRRGSVAGTAAGRAAADVQATNRRDQRLGSTAETWIHFSGVPGSDHSQVELLAPRGNCRGGGTRASRVMPGSDANLAATLAAFWTEVRDARKVA